MHFIDIPSRLHHPVMEHGQIRPASIAHGIGCGSLPLLRFDFSLAVHWYHKLRLCRDCLCVHLPAIPRLRISPGPLVSLPTDLSRVDN